MVYPKSTSLVSRDGILPLPAKVRAISNFPTPKTPTALEQFLGMVNFYHVFVPKAAEVMKPLYKTLSVKPRPKELEWTSELDLAFQKAKCLLADATLLHHPVLGAKTVLTTDASDVAIGAVLEQQIDEHWQPLAFFSRQLNKAERNYSTIDRELLGIHSSVLHFRYSRHLATISEFTTDIQHVSGKDNVVPDALSRAAINTVKQQTAPLFQSQDVASPQLQPANGQVPYFPILQPANGQVPYFPILQPANGQVPYFPQFQAASCQVPCFPTEPINAIKPGLDYRAMATDQQNDPDIQNYRTTITNLRVEDIPFENGTFTLLCDVSTGVARPIVPENWRKKVFDTIHLLSHPGARTTKKLVSSKFVWHGLGRQIMIWARCCLPC